jgi:phosphoglycolate phosphatase
MKKLIVYDLDGTLIDTLDDITVSANHMLRQLGSPFIDRQVIRAYVGRGLHDLVARCLQSADEARIAEGMKVYRRFYSQHMLDQSCVYPYAREVLTYFQPRAQAVITNKPDPYATQMLQALGIAAFLCAIIAGDGPYPKKPNPASLRALMERTGAGVEQTVFIGDSCVDIETGRQAGVFTVAVTHGLEDPQVLAAGRPDRIFSDFSQMLACARSEAW